jgi:hypothetical protein
MPRVERSSATCASGRARDGRALHDLGWKVSKNTVAASMRSQGLVARPKKKRRGLTEAPSKEEVMELLQAAARTAPVVGDDSAGTPRRTA